MSQGLAVSGYWEGRAQVPKSSRRFVYLTVCRRNKGGEYDISIGFKLFSPNINRVVNCWPPAVRQDTLLPSLWRIVTNCQCSSLSGMRISADAFILVANRASAVGLLIGSGEFPGEDIGGDCCTRYLAGGTWLLAIYSHASINWSPYSEMSR